MTTPIKVGLNLLWLVPGVVGGSEEYIVRLLHSWVEAQTEASFDDLHLTLFVNSAFPEAYPELVAAFPTVVAPVSGRSKPLRVAAESAWLGRQSRRRGIRVMHHLGGVLPAWRPTATILLVHDLQPLALPGNFSRLKRSFLAFTIPRSVRAADAIMVLTEFNRRDIVERLEVAADRIAVIPPGFDLPEQSPNTAERQRVRAAYDLGDRPFFLYPAITYPHKNHLVLLDAFGALRAERPDALLVLTGGEAQMEEEIRARAEQLGITDAIRRTGRVPGEDVDVLYCEAVALTLPSLYEGFGLPALEAMSRGCPVIVADSTALPEVVGKAGVLVAPSDPDEWSAAMARLLDDPTLRDSLIAAGPEQARQFDWSTCVAAVADLYRRFQP